MNFNDFSSLVFVGFVFTLAISLLVNRFLWIFFLFGK